MIIHKLAETSYPISFRQSDATTLGEHLRLRHSVELIGMKRVGISNFLRFFLHHKDVIPTYVGTTEQHIFIPVDLNDLVEREIQPFWILTLKRLADAIENSEVSFDTKQKISSLFLQSIQLQDNFLTIENIKKATELIIEENLVPTIFFLRFDRMRDAVTPEFFNNIQGVIESTSKQLACVFTSERPLNQIRPEIFSRDELITFTHGMYLKPAAHSDSIIIHNTLLSRYSYSLPKSIQKSVITLTGGHMQYLYLADTILQELISSKKLENNISPEELLAIFGKDERVKLQSEEIFESFSKIERVSIRKFVQKRIVQLPDDSKYLELTGVIKNSNIFSPIFDTYLQQHRRTTLETTEFSKKEHMLYTFLYAHFDEICERDAIISAVWPEYEETGVSDWTIDRLVARLRQKLSVQKSNYSITTIKTRGYKLVQS